MQFQKQKQPMHRQTVPVCLIKLLLIAEQESVNIYIKFKSLFVNLTYSKNYGLIYFPLFVPPTDISSNPITILTIAIKIKKQLIYASFDL